MRLVVWLALLSLSACGLIHALNDFSFRLGNAGNALFLRLWRVGKHKVKIYFHSWKDFYWQFITLCEDLPVASRNAKTKTTSAYENK